MAEEVSYYTKSLSATSEEIEMLKAFCVDFGIDITITDAGHGMIVNNATDLQKALLQGFYYGLTRERINLSASDLGKCSNPACKRPATHKLGDYPFCDGCLPGARDSNH
jgi:hypothetical protein